jgi:protein-S-isoprenylcysteine O-methyltransferase Ste14
MTTDKPEAGPGKPSILRRFQDLLGVGPLLLLVGLLLEGLTVVLQQWISFAIELAPEVQVILTVLCVAACLLGVTWFNRTLDLVRIHLRQGQHELVTWGPFAFVRHPLYSALILTIPPLFVIWFSDLLFLLPWFLILAAGRYIVSFEERKLVQEFGPAYERYCVYVPALLPYKGAGGRRYREACGDQQQEPPK